MVQSRKAQITIFIILGMVLLASAAFLFYLVSSTTVSKLETEQETSIAGIFQKEGLRLFVEDCIKDSLEDGLIKIGEGGRLWYDTSEIEGALAFSDDYNGINYAGNLYYLGLTNDLNLEYQNSYPCEGELNETPVFCKYLYQDPADFGHKESLTKTSIAGDLEKYLRNATLDCVEEFLVSELSYSEELEEGELKLNLEIQSDGINVDAEYPLELTVEGETYFHLTEFDYFYPSSFQTFLQKAVTTPLNKEAGDVDFNWTEEELTSGRITSGYSLLSPTLTITEVGENSVGLGHKVINYQLDRGHILEHQPYSFSFAIQNRPPALDYIQREACVDYDVAVIPDSNYEFESINLTAIAYDPDQDNITFTYHPGDVLDNTLIFNWEQYDDLENQLAHISTEIPELFINYGIYNVTINATDTHGLSDWQDVRVLIDRPLEIEIAVENAYAEFDEFYSTSILYPYPVISIEDPFYIRVKTPIESAASDVAQEAYLKYTDSENHGNFEYFLPAGLDTENCFSFPWLPGLCNLDSYTEEEIINWQSLIQTPLEYSHMNYSGADDSPYGIFGEVSVEFSSTYCATFTQQDSAEQQVQVAQCIPYINEAHPYAYPYHNIFYDVESEEYSEEEINPFLATHSCCDQTNKFLPGGTECYQSPSGCYGAVPEITEGIPGYLREVQTDFCSGTRGNVCGTLDESGISTTLVSDIPYGIMQCGNRDIASCNRVEERCQDKTSWSTNSEEQYWCHGTLGCSSVCEYTSSTGNFPIYVGNPGELPTSTLAYYAYNEKLQNDNDLQVTCGQCIDNVGKPCDSDYDGSFDGICDQLRGEYICQAI